MKSSSIVKPNSDHELGSNLGPNAAKHGPKPYTMTQNKARRTNKIDFFQLPAEQVVSRVLNLIEMVSAKARPVPSV